MLKNYTLYMVTRKANTSNTDVFIGHTHIPYDNIGDHIWCYQDQVVKGYYKNSKICQPMKQTGPTNWEVRPIPTRLCTKKEILALKKQTIKDYKAGLNVNTPVK